MRVEEQHEPKLPGQPSRLEAEEFIRSLVRWAGPGFHPDTDFNDYVTADAGIRSYPVAQADRLNSALDRAIAVLGRGDEDVYDIAAPVQRALLTPYLGGSSLDG